MEVPADPAANGYWQPNPYIDITKRILEHLRTEFESTEGWQPICEYPCPHNIIFVALPEGLLLTYASGFSSNYSNKGWHRHGKEGS